jgi:hypothetical protein
MAAMTAAGGVVGGGGPGGGGNGGGLSNGIIAGAGADNMDDLFSLFLKSEPDVS